MINKFLHRPVTPFSINQQFGENNACVNTKNPKDVITCDGTKPPKGYRSLYKKGHGGLDLMARRFTPIYATHDGTVTEVVDEELRGLGLGIVTARRYWCEETESFTHFKTRYWHSYIHKVRLNEEVKIGDLIAWADNTGYSSGDHLHFELKPVTIEYNRDGSVKKTNNTLQSNGYYGSIDPMRYLGTLPAVRLQGVKSFTERLIWALKGNK